MGNTNTHVCGGVLIAFDRGFYYPGDVVNANIYLNMVTAFETTGIEITVETLEHTEFEETESYEETRTETGPNGESRTVTETRTRTVIRTGSRTLFKSQTIIASMRNNLLGTGQYCYPVTFSLPSHLPGSFEYYDSESMAYVKYVVTARALSFLSSYKDISNSTILIVRQPAVNFSYPTNLSDTKNLKTWCFFDQGSATLNISYPKNHFTHDESVQVIAELNNTRCRLNCTCLKLQLFQRIKLKDNIGRSYYRNRLIAQNRVEGEYV